MRRAGLRRALGGVVPALVVLGGGLVARADAPPDQYQQFGTGDTTILDAQTGLRWQRTVTTATNFAGAVAICSAASSRLPSYKELLTLVDENPHLEYPTGAPQPIAIDPNAFPRTPVDLPYWSSSSDLASSGYVFVVDFATGASHSQHGTDTGYVRCVGN